MVLRRLRVTAGWAAIAGLLVAVATAGCSSRQAASPTLGELPAFDLTDQAGRPLRHADLAGKVALINFIYTSCTDICPGMTARMRAVQERLREAGLTPERVRLVSISVDPERDRPEVLAAYAARFKADTSGWHFLTGATADVRKVVVDGFKLGLEAAAPAAAHGHRPDPATATAGASHATAPAAPAAPSGIIAHSDRFVLVDGAGRIRAYYRGDELDAARVVADVRRLAAARAAKAGATGGA